MSQTEELAPPVLPPEDEDKTTRRLLIVLLTILGLATVALLALLLWLLRPESAPPPIGQAPGYPIDVVTTIYGYGEEPEELLASPLAAQLDGDGNVWIANTGRSRVDVFTSGGDYIRSVGVDEDGGKLYAPYGIAVDEERDVVYVADFGNGAVQIFTKEGAYAGHLPSDEQKLTVFGDGGFTPYDVGFRDGRVIVSSNDGLYAFDAEGLVAERWGYTDKKGNNVRGVDLGMFNYPNAFAVDDGTGITYVADSMNRRVVALGREGKWLWVSGLPDADGAMSGFWQLPHGIEIGDDGNLYVVDTFRFDDEGMGTGHIVVLSPSGDLLSEFGRAGTDDGAFDFPEHLSSGPDGLWAIADRVNQRVVIFRLITPYPEVDDLLAEKYPEGFEMPEDVWSTPQEATEP